MEFLIIVLLVVFFPVINVLAFWHLDKIMNEETTSLVINYKNNKNNVIFTELVRYETESVMLRTDINVRMLIPHIELDKHYTKLDK